MSLVNLIHSTIKFFCLAFLSITHSFNYLNHIPFIILCLKDKENIDKKFYFYIIFFFIIYDIMKNFTNNLTLRINRFIGIHIYYSLSICVLAIINLIFSFISFSYSNVFIFIFHRIFISLFNNIVPYIDLPLSLLYTRKQFPFKKRNFSFLQKICNFLFFLFFLLLFKYCRNFYFYCFIISFLNLLCFILSLIILGCNKENINSNYYANITEKEKNQFIKNYKLNVKTNNNKQDEVQSKNAKSINEIGNLENNNTNSVINNNISIHNNTSNLMKQQQQTLILNKNNNNIIKIEEQATNESTGNYNSQTLRGFLFPFLFSDNNINQNLYPQKIRIIISLLIAFIFSKCLNFLSSFMLIFKIRKITLYSYIYKNSELLFPELSSVFKLSTLKQEYIFLFMCSYFLNIILYLINMSYTSFAVKRKCINYFFYYFSLSIFLVSCFLFIYYYLRQSTNIIYDNNEIRKDIIFLFLFNLIMNECNMIMSIFYNIIGKNSGFIEKTLKEIKSLSVFLAGILFILIQSLLIFFTSDEYSFENYFHYIIFGAFILIIYIISIIFL